VIGKQACDALHPFWIQKMKEHNVCCCIYHVEIEELCVKFNHMWLKSRLHSYFHYDYEVVCEGVDDSNTVGCMGSHAIYSSHIALWEAMVCPKDPHLEWRAQDFAFGGCEHYNVNNLALCPIEEEGTSCTLVQWKHFSMETIITKKGEKKKLKLMHKSTISKEFIQYMKPKLQYFFHHNVVARWQAQQFKTYLEFFSNDTIVSMIDFC
jgi:hypothetical protein